MNFTISLQISGGNKACLLALLMIFIHFHSYSQSCDCPAIDECGPCEGGLTSLTLRYDAPVLGLPAVITVSDKEGIIFTGTVNDGEEFTFTGSVANEPFVGDTVTITADVLATVNIYTSCSTPVYVGDVYDNYTVTAGQSQSGYSICCSADTMEDVPPLFSNCPADINITLSDSECSIAVDWIPPTATDDCGIADSTNNHNPGDTFSIGATEVVYTATDIYGNTSICSFNIIVNDQTAPVIEGCPDNINLNTSPESACGSQASWTEPTASDNCSVTRTSTHKPGHFFPRGKTTVTYTATDGSGNTTSCSFDVIANDATKPVISGCPASDILASAGKSCEVSVTWDEITATDNCNSVVRTSTHNSGDMFPVGKTKVTYTATDDTGNSSKCSFQVVVTETAAPVISGCPSDIVATTDATCAAIASWTAPTATDNCREVTLTSTHNPGDAFPVGTTTVTYTATDEAGNSATCSFNVIVNDETAPVITGCPSNIMATTDNSCQVNVSWTAPTATDNCQNVTLTSTYSSGDIFPTGITQVIYTATDDAGNSATCSFDVIVSDESDPVISGCPDDIIAKVDESGQVRVDWTIPTAEVFCGDVVLQGSHEPGDYFSLGTTEVEYTATDDAGNSTSCKFKVILSYEEIEFDIPKVITPDGNGVNDEWLLKNIEKFKHNKVVIVDRWGSTIFSTSGYNNENVVWKGTNRNGMQLPSGTYFYTISVRFASQVVEKRGFIELIR